MERVDTDRMLFEILLAIDLFWILFIIVLLFKFRHKYNTKPKFKLFMKHEDFHKQFWGLPDTTLACYSPSISLIGITLDTHTRYHSFWIPTAIADSLTHESIHCAIHNCMGRKYYKLTDEEHELLVSMMMESTPIVV